MGASVLWTLSLVIGSSAIVGLAAKRSKRCRLPSVVGQVALGVGAGPSLLGRYAPAVSHDLFLAGARPVLTALSNLGVAVLMFLCGTELRFERKGSRTVAGSVVGTGTRRQRRVRIESVLTVEG